MSLDRVAIHFPELNLIGIHLGYPWTDEMISVCWKHPNVFIGCDAHSPKYWPNSFFNYINTFGQDKVILGTDFPILDFERTLKQIDDLQLRPIPKQKLLRDNAIRIYKLDLEKLTDHAT
jgi:predicted TIM-barrel fold metal-dependent hydrolase